MTFVADAPLGRAHARANPWLLIWIGALVMTFLYGDAIATSGDTVVDDNAAEAVPVPV